MYKITLYTKTAKIRKKGDITQHDVARVSIIG